MLNVQDSSRDSASHRDDPVGRLPRGIIASSHAILNFLDISLRAVSHPREIIHAGVPTVHACAYAANCCFKATYSTELKLEFASSGERLHREMERSLIRQDVRPAV